MNPPIYIHCQPPEEVQSLEFLGPPSARIPRPAMTSPWPNISESWPKKASRKLGILCCHSFNNQNEEWPESLLSIVQWSTALSPIGWCPSITSVLPGPLESKAHHY